MEQFVLIEETNECFNEAVHRKARLNKTNVYKDPARILSNQGPFLRD